MNYPVYMGRTNYRSSHSSATEQNHSYVPAGQKSQRWPDFMVTPNSLSLLRSRKGRSVPVNCSRISNSISSIRLHLLLITTFSCMFCMLVAMVMQRKRRQHEFLLKIFFQGCTLPTGFALLICSFKSSLFSKMDSVNVYIAIDSIILLYIYRSKLYSPIFSAR